MYLDAVEQAFKNEDFHDSVIYAAELSGLNDYFTDSEIEGSAKVCGKIREMIDALDVDECLRDIEQTGQTGFFAKWIEDYKCVKCSIACRVIYVPISVYKLHFW